MTGPGKLMCRAIIHVRARNSLSTWADTIRKCLLVTEKHGLNSIAFPALGTGKGYVLCLPVGVIADFRVYAGQYRGQ